ncbi:MAG: hypothetical protein ACXAD7_18375, partial [Candidatus Kariarchaeaceae archaeon]
MAPIGTVLKNGLIFAVLSAPLLYLAAYQFANGLIDILWTFGVGGNREDGNAYVNEGYWNTGILEVFLGLLFSITVVGIIFMKTLSDTVEEGMIEF